MKRLIKWVAGVVASLLVMIGIAILGWNVIDRPPAVAEGREATTQFDAQALYVLIDADMAATAYADGILHPIADASDKLISFSDLGNANPERRVTSVTNTVMGWPGSMSASPDMSRLYVVTARDQPDRSIEAFAGGVIAEMPLARQLNTIDSETGEIIASAETCAHPMAVDVASNGTWLLIACGNNEAQLQIFAIVDGVPSDPRTFTLDVPVYELAEAEPGARFASVHPSNAAAGVILHNRVVVRADFSLDEAGVPDAVTVGETLDTGGWLSMSRWTPSGGQFIATDVAWGPAPTDALFNSNGRLLSISMPAAGQPIIRSQVEVSKSPESFEFNRQGDMIAVVNMERTGVPSGVLSLAPGRSSSSLSLVGVDDATGELVLHGDPIGFRGVLPEDVAFDADGDQLAVVVFQDHDAPRSDGWLTYFEIENTDQGPRLVPLKKRTPLPRGGHDLLARY